MNLLWNDHLAFLKKGIISPHVFHQFWLPNLHGIRIFFLWSEISLKSTPGKKHLLRVPRFHLDKVSFETKYISGRRYQYAIVSFK